MGFNKLRTLWHFSDLFLWPAKSASGAKIKISNQSALRLYRGAKTAEESNRVTTLYGLIHAEIPRELIQRELLITHCYVLHQNIYTPQKPKHRQKKVIILKRQKCATIGKRIGENRD